MITTVAQKCAGVACYYVMAWPDHAVHVINKCMSEQLILQLNAQIYYS
jgi:hypothetical protein